MLHNMTLRNGVAPKQTKTVNKTHRQKLQMTETLSDDREMNSARTQLQELYLEILKSF